MNRRDQAVTGNLNWRTNNALLQRFTVNNLNELSNSTRSGTLTVAGAVSGPATSVTVNGQNAALYTDWTFAKDGFTLANGTNTFTAIAQDGAGRMDTNTVIVNLPASNVFAYDLNGNLLSDGNRCFAYDDENQLTSVWVTNQWRSDFVYDGKMRRRIRREYAWQSGIWNLQSEIRYLYDGNLVIQERDANNLPLVSYTRGRDLSGSLEGAGGIGGLLARTDLSALTPGLSTAFYHADGNGNVTTLINTNQLIVARYYYDPYGNILSQSGPLAEGNLYRFSSKELHSHSGLVYYLYRYYGPALQRWLNRDQIKENGGLNLYKFAGNAPVLKLDPNGRSTTVIVVIIVIGTGVAVLELCHLKACFDAEARWRDAVLACKKEGEQALKTIEGELNFYDKYGAPDWTTAIYNCAQKKDPGALANMIAKCGKSAANSYAYGSLPEIPVENPVH